MRSRKPLGNFKDDWVSILIECNLGSISVWNGFMCDRFCGFHINNTNKQFFSSQNQIYSILVFGGGNTRRSTGASFGLLIAIGGCFYFLVVMFYNRMAELFVNVWRLCQVQQDKAIFFVIMQHVAGR